MASPSRSSAARRQRYGCCRGVAIASFLLLCSIARAQDVMESPLKAAFIYNFAKFTEWPPDVMPAGAPFTACVLGDVSLREALERVVKGRQFSGRAILVSDVQLEGKLRSCHLLYISGTTAARVTSAIAAVGNAPVLTISDLDNFTQIGGMVQLFGENGQMHFNLNLAAARQARLMLSSKLIVLAAHVRGNPKSSSP
ncbi:MAG: YfiR family protein [Acidobacteriota bacterium]